MDNSFFIVLIFLLYHRVLFCGSFCKYIIMPKRGELFKAAIIDNDSTQALYITCLYVIKTQFTYLEDEWIAMSSHIGKKEGMSFGKTWANVNTDIVSIIDSDEFHIKNALLCTTKLMLLNQRDIDIKKSQHVQQLRKVVIDCFPNQAMLSSPGKELFHRILPPENHELYGFYNRILAGFSKIIVENKYDDIRNGLEYVSRKKLSLPLEGIWPAPTESDAFSGDPCWFLWGMILSIYSKNENVATNFKLFLLNWRKSVRNDRIGLLWGISYIIDDSCELLWTEYELCVFEKIKTVSSELWNFALNEHKKLTVTENIKEESEFENIEKKSLNSFYESFVPRKASTNDYEMDSIVESMNKNWSTNNNNYSISTATATYRNGNGVEAAGEYLPVKVLNIDSGGKNNGKIASANNRVNGAKGVKSENSTTTDNYKIKKLDSILNSY